MGTNFIMEMKRSKGLVLVDECKGRGSIMTGKQWIDSFIESLFEQRIEANDKKYDNNSSLWTEFMVKKVMKEVIRNKIGCRIVCRDKDDNENSGEYLNLGRKERI